MLNVALSTALGSLRTLFAHRSSVALTGGVMFLLLGCMRSDLEASKQETITSGFNVTKELISPVNCVLTSGRFRNCAFPVTHWTPTQFPTAVPLRTTIVPSISGNCSTQFPLEATFRAPGMSDTSVSFLAGRTQKLRRTGGKIFDDLTFIDLSPWTPTASFDQSCRAALQITFNEVDVDSQNDAVVIVTQLEQELTEKTRIRDRAVQLVEFANAFSFVRELLNAFHHELTNQQMHDLRQLALANADNMATLVSGCEVIDATGNHFPTREQRQGLTELFLALGTLGDPGVWNHPDGSPITIAEFLGPEQVRILATLNAIVDATNGTSPAIYAAEAQTASAAVADTTTRIALARQQLAGWL